MSALIQQTPEWLEMRKNKIGASDAPVIMGVSPWMTPYALWEEKLGIRKGRPQNEAMRRGLELEEMARKSFEEKTGIIVFPQVVFHPENEWMMASLDGMDIEQKHIVEIKCANSEDHEHAKQGKIPDKYFPQLQHQLEVTGLDTAFYYSFDGKEGVVVECHRNTKYIRDLVDEEKAFWSCMQNFVAPKLSERDYTIREDDVWTMCAEQWKSAQKGLIELEKKEKELRDLLISMTNGTNVKGAGITVSKVVRKGNIDYAKVTELKGVNLEPYRKEPIEFWRIGK